MQNKDIPVQAQNKNLISRKAWIVISIISLLTALSNASKSRSNGPQEFIPLVVGGVIGGLLLFGGVWALAMLVSRWISRRSRKYPVIHN